MSSVHVRIGHGGSFRIRCCQHSGVQLLWGCHGELQVWLKICRVYQLLTATENTPLQGWQCWVEVHNRHRLPTVALPDKTHSHLSPGVATGNTTLVVAGGHQVALLAPLVIVAGVPPNSHTAQQLTAANKITCQNSASPSFQQISPAECVRLPSTHTGCAVPIVGVQQGAHRALLPSGIPVAWVPLAPMHSEDNLSFLPSA
ncbi:hypothetical protein CCHOA_04865 [Corynebacterium choanae]|uniref:Uncharacterized protein n=1 Tax=Corynebacterium choanae TaxID=1862358 RepID=A0A3G6J5L1_9CORY|nr:hypothetical protein CCHOA_04865 [Corynebacterium choanae]